MHDTVLTKIKLYEGGLGIIELKKNERIYARDIKIDHVAQIVSGIKEEMQFGGDRQNTEEGIQYPFANKHTPFEISFDEITGFEGRQLQ